MGEVRETNGGIIVKNGEGMWRNEGRCRVRHVLLWT